MCGEFSIAKEQTWDQFGSNPYSYCFIKEFSHAGLDNLDLSFHGPCGGRGSTSGTCMAGGVVECLIGLAKLNVTKGCDSCQNKSKLRILHFNYIQSASTQARVVNFMESTVNI